MPCAPRNVRDHRLVQPGDRLAQRRGVRRAGHRERRDEHRPRARRRRPAGRRRVTAAARSAGLTVVPGVDRLARELQALAVQGVDDQQAQRGGVADDGDPAARRQRLVGQQLGDVEQLCDVLRPGSRPECSNSACTRGLVAPADAARRERRRRRRRRVHRPHFTAMTGLVRASRRASRANLRGLPNDSRYSSTTSVAGVALPVLQQVVARHVGAVAGGDEGRQAQPALGGGGQERDAERAGLAEEADPAGRRQHRRQRGVQPHLPGRC